MRYPLDFEGWLRRIERRLSRLESQSVTSPGYGYGTIPSSSVASGSYTQLSVAATDLLGVTTVGGALFVQRSGWWIVSARFDWSPFNNNGVRAESAIKVPLYKTFRAQLGTGSGQTHNTALVRCDVGDAVEFAVQHEYPANVNIEGNWFVRHIGGE